MQESNLLSSTPNPTSYPPGIYYDYQRSCYVLDFIKVLQGKRIHIRAKGLLSVEEAMDEKRRLIEEAMEKNEKANAVSISFSQFMNRFIEYRSRHVRGSSLSQATTVYHKYFYSDRMQPAAILLEYPRMMNIYASIVDDTNLCASWKNRMIGILRNIASCAFRWKIIDGNLYQDLAALLENIPEDQRRKERQIWTEAEEQRFLSVIDNEDHKVMFTLFLELGARISEFLGLTWDVYDAKRGRIRICRQLINGSQKTYVLSSILKTKESYRECHLRRSTKELLNAYRKNRDDVPPYMFVSSYDATKPLSKAAFRTLFEKYISLAKVRRITPHCVRHTKASRLLKVCKNMLEVKAVARFMGHSPTILMDVYSHSDDELIDRVLKRLG